MNMTREKQGESEMILSLQLDPLLSEALSTGGTLAVSAQKMLAEGIAKLLVELGIPGSLRVEMSTAQFPFSENQFLHLTVNGQLCPYSSDLASWACSYICQSHFGPTESKSNLLDRLKVVDGGLVKFILLQCLEILKIQPAVLLELPQLEAYCAGLPAPSTDPLNEQYAWRLHPDRLLTVFQHVLSLRISLADTQILTNTISQAVDSDPIEDLIAALRPGFIEILLSEQTLKQITLADYNGQGLLSRLRDDLFLELGITLPTIRFLQVDDMEPGCFAFRINHLTSMPKLGLKPDQCLVNDTPERLRYIGIDAQPATNPASGKLFSLIHLSDKGMAEQSGLTTWDQAGYLAFCLAVALRRNSVCFIDRNSVNEQIHLLGKAYPALEEAFGASLYAQDLVPVLRALTSEGIPIRNLKLILERLLDCSLSSVKTASGGKHSLDRLLSFVRAGLQREIRFKYARGTDTVVVYLLDPAIEQMLKNRVVKGKTGIDPNQSQQEVQEQILAAIRTEIAYLSAAALLPVVLTKDELRPVLRRMIAQEFPELAVIAYEDLPPDANVQPVSRILLQ